jgi:anti-anti-sigma factor
VGSEAINEMFSATVRRVDGRAIVEIVGELDLTSIEPLRAKLREALVEGVDTIEVDAAGVTFIDSVNLALLLAFQVNAPKEGRVFRVVAASEEFVRIVSVAGLGEALLPPPAEPTDPPEATDPSDSSD